MYIKIAERKVIDEINEYIKENGEPKDFYKWLDSFKYNLGLKRKDTCTCNNCKVDFKTGAKVNGYITCPNCKTKLLVKRFNIKCYDFKEYYHLIQKYLDDSNKKYIVRKFEIRSYWDYKSKKFKNDILEIMRFILKDNGSIEFSAIISTMKKNTGGYFYIEYWNKKCFWKPNPYTTYAIYGKYYPCNVDEVLLTKYYKISELFDNVNELNICDIVAGVKDNNYQLEMLVKSKLYNLALTYFEFNNGTFENVFKVDHSYLQFMVDNNITFDELKVLQKFKIKDINLIRYYDSFSYWRLDDVLKYCNPIELYKYNLKSYMLSEYIDYLGFLKKLRYNLKDKKYLYPDNLKEEHDKLQKIIEIKKSKSINGKLKKRFNELKKNIFNNKKYIIYPVGSVDELIDESNQQNNCVKTYAEKYANSECDIYFMRYLNSKDKSLVTVEVRGNKVVQKRIKNNANTDKSQNMFLKKWEERLND